MDLSSGGRGAGSAAARSRLEISADRRTGLEVKVTLHSQQHEWHQNDAQGRRRYVRASWDSRKWSFSETFKDAPAWMTVDAPTRQDYEALRDILWRKYQRNRVPWRFVEQVDSVLAEMGGAPD